MLPAEPADPYRTQPNNESDPVLEPEEGVCTPGRSAAETENQRNIARVFQAAKMLQSTFSLSLRTSAHLVSSCEGHIHQMTTVKEDSSRHSMYMCMCIMKYLEEPSLTAKEATEKMYSSTF